MNHGGLMTVVGVFIYVVFTVHSLYQSASPAEICNVPSEDNNTRDHHCLWPLLSPNDTLLLDLWTYTDSNTDDHTDTERRRNFFSWNKVDSCSSFAVDLSETVTRIQGRNCTVALPDAARARAPILDTSDYHESAKVGVGFPLKAKFVLSHNNGHGANNNSGRVVVAEAHFELTRMVERREYASLSSSSSDVQEKILIPHYKYGNQNMVLRIVGEYRSYGSIFRSDGVRMPRHIDNRSRQKTNLYRPLVYVDESALRHGAQIPMAPPNNTSSNNTASSRPPTPLSIKVSVISPERDLLHRLVRDGLALAETTLGLHSSELDEIKFFLRDEYFYRFLLTQVISVSHVYLDYLAFRDEVRFYRGKSTLVGVSSWTLMTHLLCSVILFLYLMDGGNTSTIILVTIGGEVCVQGWKVCRILRMKHKQQQQQLQHKEAPATTTDTPSSTDLATADIRVLERKTREYDRIAITYLSLLLYPLIVGMGLHGLRFDNYYTFTSYYSWLISNLANAVYTFGFIALCPQLYVNYRLQSVAHLPWKVFVYKLFNTFIDDVFAVLISMPWKHRIMTLRDDVVFLVFLYQAYIYRVDKHRPNEFGYVYGDATNNDNGGQSTLPVETATNNVTSTEADAERKKKKE